MATITRRLWLKSVAAVLVVSFIALDIVWAYPATPAENATLSVQSLFQQSIQAELAAKSLAICGIAKFLYGDKDTGERPFELKYLQSTLSAEIRRGLDGIDLSKVVLKDNGIILIPFESGRGKFLIQVALKDNPVAKEVTGYEGGISDKYVVKVAARLRASQETLASAKPGSSDMEANSTKNSDAVVEKAKREHEVISFIREWKHRIAQKDFLIWNPYSDQTSLREMYYGTRNKAILVRGAADLVNSISYQFKFNAEQRVEFINWLVGRIGYEYLWGSEIQLGQPHVEFFGTEKKDGPAVLNDAEYMLEIQRFIDSVKIGEEFAATRIWMGFRESARDISWASDLLKGHPWQDGADNGYLKSALVYFLSTDDPTRHNGAIWIVNQKVQLPGETIEGAIRRMYREVELLHYRSGLRPSQGAEDAFVRRASKEAIQKTHIASPYGFQKPGSSDMEKGDWTAVDWGSANSRAPESTTDDVVAKKGEDVKPAVISAQDQVKSAVRASDKKPEPYFNPWEGDNTRESVREMMEGYSHDSNSGVIEGPNCNIQREGYQLSDSTFENGAQILDVPVGSRINGVTIKGGASKDSKFADLRGGVMKFDRSRAGRRVIIGGITVPSSHTLMDQERWKNTADRLYGSDAGSIPFIEVQMGEEVMILVHSSYCHPKELLLKQGTFTDASFQSSVDHFGGHGAYLNGQYDLEEAQLEEMRLKELKKGDGKYAEQGYLIDPPDGCERIVIKLKDGGYMIRTKSLKEIYEGISKGFRAVTDYPDKQGLAKIEIGYEPAENSRRKPARTNILGTSFDLPRGALSETLERLTDEVIRVLPAGTMYHKMDPNTYHVSVLPIQDLPFDDLRNRLTPSERKAAEETVARIAANELPYSVKLVGLRFGTDGGVIAVFEDEGLRTRALRDVLIKECNEVCGNKVSKARNKPLVSITLMRILSRVEGAGLAALKKKAEALKDLSPLGLGMECRSLVFSHETRWMHTEFDYTATYHLGAPKDAASHPASVDTQRTEPEATAAQKTKNVTELFEIVENTINNERARVVRLSNQLFENLSQGMSDDLLHVEDSTAEIKANADEMLKLAEMAALWNDEDSACRVADELKNSMDQFEADSIVGAIIVLARRAKFENQKLIIGLETDWIPGYSDKGSYQRNAISSLVNEVASLDKTLRSMGLENVVIVHKSKDELANAVSDEAARTNTKLTNVVLFGSNTTLNSEAFNALRSTPGEARAFMAGIDSSELESFYSDHKNSMENQLKIRLMEMLCVALELAIGKEPPQLPIIAAYDKVLRTVTFLPKVEPADYEEIRRFYNAARTALQAA